MTKRTVFVIGLLALSGSVGGLVLRSSTTGPRAAAPAAVDEPVVVAAGRTEPASEEIDVATEIDGRLRRVLVEEGQTVRRYQVLAELDNADFGARVALARARVAERQAACERASNGSRPMQRREMSAQVREAEAVLDNARSECARRRMLLDRGAISRMEFEVAERELRVAEARLDAARERTAFVEDEVRPEEKARAAAELEGARAALSEAEALLAKTVIRSPIDGTVLRKHKNAGESVSTQVREAVVTLGDTVRMRVRAEVDETDVARLRVGQRAWVTAVAYGDRRFTGKVIRISRMLGRKKVQTDAPAEKVDTKVLETLIELDAGTRIPIGLRVDTYIEATPRS